LIYPRFSESFFISTYLALVVCLDQREEVGWIGIEKTALALWLEDDGFSHETSHHKDQALEPKKDKRIKWFSNQHLCLCSTCGKPRDTCDWAFECCALDGGCRCSNFTLSY
jgi:hypothetical protein